MIADQPIQPYTDVFCLQDRTRIRTPKVQEGMDDITQAVRSLFVYPYAFLWN